MDRMKVDSLCPTVVAACVVTVPCLESRACSCRLVAPQPSASVCLCRSSSQHLHSAHVYELSSGVPGGCDQAKVVIVELPYEFELAMLSTANKQQIACASFNIGPQLNAGQKAAYAYLVWQRITSATGLGKGQRLLVTRDGLVWRGLEFRVNRWGGIIGTHTLSLAGQL